MNPILKTRGRLLTMVVGMAAACAFIAAFLLRFSHKGKTWNKTTIETTNETTEMFSKTISARVGERAMLFSIRSHNPNVLQELDIQAVSNQLFQWFENLDWPAHIPVVIEDKGNDWTVTFPVGPELESEPYRSDYTLQIILDRKTQKVVRVSGG